MFFLSEGNGMYNTIREGDDNVWCDVKKDPEKKVAKNW